MARKLYVMQTTRHDSVPGAQCSYSYMLHEMSPAEFKQAEAEAAPHVRFAVWQWQSAHRWVREDGLHSTGLWVDGERVRYAPADPGA
jgi:hypothetical protein